MRIWLALGALAGLAWRPLLGPLVRGLIALAHIYSTALIGRSIAALVTPTPRTWETHESFAGVEMRVGWWRPGWGARHPAMLLVIGATPEGIDFPELRVAAEGFARAGFLVMIPDLPFMREERLDPTGPAQIGAAFAALGKHLAAREPIGAFGFSIGGGVLLAAAAREAAFVDASYVAVLGAYFDIATYIASVASREQRRDGRVVPWEPNPDVPERLAASAVKLAGDEEERAALSRALAASSYEEALERIRGLPPRLRGALDALSSRPAWERIRQPVFWLHDERDRYVPIAEADAACRAAREAPLTLAALRLLQHAVPVADAARGEGPRFWASELWTLLRFAASLLRVAG